MTFTTRAAVPSDAEAIAEIRNQGIADRRAERERHGRGLVIVDRLPANLD